MPHISRVAAAANKSSSTKRRLRLAGDEDAVILGQIQGGGPLFYEHQAALATSISILHTCDT